MSRPVVERERPLGIKLKTFLPRLSHVQREWKSELALIIFYKGLCYFSEMLQRNVAYLSLLFWDILLADATICPKHRCPLFFPELSGNILLSLMYQ